MIFSVLLSEKYFPNSRQSCQVTLQLLSSGIWSACFLCMDIGVAEGSHQWYHWKFKIYAFKLNLNSIEKYFHLVLNETET